MVFTVRRKNPKLSVQQGLNKKYFTFSPRRMFSTLSISKVNSHNRVSLEVKKYVILDSTKLFLPKDIFFPVIKLVNTTSPPWACELVKHTLIRGPYNYCVINQYTGALDNYLNLGHYSSVQKCFVRVRN